MSSSGVRHQASLLSEFVPAIFGALGWVSDCGCDHLDLFLIGMPACVL